MQNKKFQWFVIITIGAGLFFILAWVYIHQLQAGIDWRDNFRRPALYFLTTGHYPFQYNANYPFWLYLILAPLAVLPPFLGAVLVAMACMGSFGYVAYKQGFSPGAILIFLLMPQLLFLATNGNIDWLIIWGFLMPPTWGLFFVLIKPQIGLAVAVYWVYRAWQAQGIKGAVLTVLPVGLAYGFSLLLWGYKSIIPPMGQFTSQLLPWDSNIWPTGLALGLLLMYQAVKGANQKKAILAGPFFAPYVAFYSWPAAMLGLGSSKELIIASYGAWLVWMITQVSGNGL